jgi:integrase
VDGENDSQRIKASFAQCCLPRSIHGTWQSTEIPILVFGSSRFTTDRDSLTSDTGYSDVYPHAVNVHDDSAPNALGWGRLAASQSSSPTISAACWSARCRRRGFKTKKEAQDALSEIHHAARTGGYVEPSRQTLAKFLQGWILTIKPTARPATWASYERNLRVHVIPRIGGYPLQGINAGTVAQLYADLLADGHRGINGYARPRDDSTNSRPAGLSPRTVAYIGTILHRAFDDAVRWGRLVRNPADAVKRPKIPSASSTVTAWDAATLGDFLARSKAYIGKGGTADRYYAVWVLLATTGLRRGEALGLRWSDLDLDSAVLSVSQTVIAVDHEQVIGTPKTAAGARAVELDSTTISALREHRRNQLEERLLMGAGFTDRGFVFCLPDGRP